MAQGNVQQDIDPQETKEWLDALHSVLRNEGPERAYYLLKRLVDDANRKGMKLPASITTPYINTLSVTEEKKIPGDPYMDRRIRSLIRWNALAMVMRTNLADPDLGGHLSSFSSSATLYDVGFNYFFNAPTDQHGGDLVFIQGHCAPGIYARSYLEGRLDEQDLDNFRREVNGGLSSYPHPWLMPDYWQFPTVSMGLGPIQAIYQAHVMRYMDNRGLIDAGQRKVWAFLGDGETDEPESLGAISLAGRENLDNLIFVVNCNLQRLDGPVRGNGKIIQELEGQFKGAGWNVIKVVWGRHWDPLLEMDRKGLLRKRMMEVVDGEMQNFKTKGGAYTREHFFGTDPELLKMVEHLSDDDIYRLNRGGHDPFKVYAAYAEAAAHTGQPTVILAQTVKGYGFGAAAEAQNNTHSVKKLDIESLKDFRDRFAIPLNDEELEKVPFYRPPADSPEMRYMQQRREELGGYLPQRRSKLEPMNIPALDAYEVVTKGSGERSISTTMAMVRIFSALVKDKQIGKRIVPIVPDEARTFGMEGMFRQLGIYSAAGQLYEPVDADQMMFYKEKKDGQILEEGINEAGAFAAWMAAATSYSHHDLPMIPFYIFYSMFGFQRIGDLAWAAGDMQARGFLIGGTSGRTTLNGEGLQHQDGHSHLMAATIPNCVAYDPTYSYELAVIIQDGMEQMYVQDRNCFYYITVMNENYPQPAIPNGVEEGIIKGMYLLKPWDSNSDDKLRIHLLGSGAILREVEAAAELLQQQFGISANIWSATSFNELRREGMSTERWNRLHPDQPARSSYVTDCLGGNDVPVIAASDYMQQYADQIREYIPQSYTVLGTDGFGRSDTRATLRNFFEVDRYYIAQAALASLHQQGQIDIKILKDAMSDWGIDADKHDPATL
ncbi:MAG: pyruvate dehydrogenase (acetyl-transferring), homodimeric type [Pseudomonadales bacterium]|nr:pyruvate dehydrogenase (acetyl-transferring), homodimeric type [Pseudomonadales bacterium]